jgi:hypothetical protein
MSIKRTRTGYRSLFWPIILIGIGLTWLLINAGIISGASLVALAQLWPILLIAIGLDLLFGRSSSLMGGLIGIVTVAAFLGLAVFGPALGLITLPERQVETLTFATDDAQSYSLNLKTGVETVTIDATTDASELVVADLVYYGEIHHSDEGTDTRTLTIEEVNSPANTLFLPGTIVNEDEPSEWRINLNPTLPVALTMDSGVGEINVDLSEVNLVSLDAKLGIGAANILLPMPQQSYAVYIDNGVGEVNIDVPDDAAIQVSIESGIGGVDVPDWLIAGGEDDGIVSVDGTWHTSGFSDAENTITIVVKGGIGSVNLR